MSYMKMFAVLCAVAFGTAGCSNMTQQQQRALSGGAIGAAGGAVAGAVIGGGVVTGAVLGGAAGAAIGAFTR